ncbi:PilN domain-containing protein [Thiothrix subterranea]|uniref:PilN domain-containing protein n=1 Tax=Thiothrix subterranea TaxID=2735563 RepID=A0AA51MKK2_9GAMM|nr:PilN domain-containing protein [Thiothrix subterranea]MDQ5769241.1 PilN domain-containing protein [Thiothrix subterranea]QQZ27799.1 PilN domain-containing protein [Thiothrix subterranea]WML86224.1 PilN domain-containing protein [Thiothrix subterranea]
MAGLNLLPWREKAREENKKQFFALVGGSVLLAAAAVFGAHQYMQYAIEHQEQRNQYLSTQIAELDKQIKEIEQLDATRQALLDRMQVIEDLQSTRPAIVHLFDEMVNALPKGMYLLHLKQDGTKVELEGKAESYARVSSYMNRLDASPWLSSSNLNIISTKKEGDNGELVLRDFKLDVTQLLRQTQDEANAAPSKPKTGTPPAAKKPNKKQEGG